MTTLKLITAAGGTRAWRRLVAAVLRRDGYVCRMLRDGHPCGAPATTADHIVSRVLGGDDAMANLQAACIPCNLAAGGKLRGNAGAELVAHHNAIIALVRLLDQHGVPVEAGRRTAMATLDVHTDHPWRGRDVEAACRYRRNRGPLTRV